jgi:hypothetical protein
MGYEMKINITAAVIFSGFFLLASGFPQAMEAAQDSKEESKPLLRVDLLLSLDKEMKPPKRNIFSPEKSTARTGPSGSAPPVNTAEQPSATENAPEFFINVKYIGYVRAPQKIVGLIMYEGMAVAVYSGEIIAEGLQIGEITAETIEIIGPNSFRQKVRLEGDQQ